MTNENPKPPKFGEVGYKFTIKTPATIIRAHKTLGGLVCHYDVRVEPLGGQPCGVFVMHGLCIKELTDLSVDNNADIAAELEAMRQEKIAEIERAEEWLYQLQAELTTIKYNEDHVRGSAK